jgi:hypothetical protein
MADEIKLIRKAEFARLCGVSRAAIASAEKTGAVISTNGRVDINHPANQRYLNGKSSFQQTDKRQSLNKKNAEKSGAEKKPIYRVDNIGALDARDKKEAIQNQILAVKLQKDKIDYYEKIKRSVPSAIMMRSFGRLGAVLDENMKAFDERHGEELYNMVKSGSSVLEFSSKLSELIDKTMKGIIRAVKKEVLAMESTQGETK